MGRQGEGPVYVLLAQLSATFLHLSLLLQLATPSEGVCRAIGWLGHLGLSIAGATLLGKLQHLASNLQDAALMRAPLEETKLLAFVGVAVGVATLLLIVRSAVPAQDFVQRDSDGGLASPVDCEDGGAVWMLMVTLQGLLYVVVYMQALFVRRVKVPAAHPPAPAPLAHSPAQSL